VAITRGIFGDEPNFDQRLITDLVELGEKVEHLRKGFDLKIVLTSGSFDLIHLGHLKYLAKARGQGDILIVGVDSDAKIRERKGDDRPMVPQEERLEVLAHTRPVDIIYLKQDDDPHWGLIKTVRPDVLVFSEDHGYSDEDMEELRGYCGQIQILERQATVTSSERIRQMYLGLGDKLGPRLAEILPDLIEKIVKGG
jgi:D-glycero-beta-D-manno-heptose 1-phosphate adenylyltransferase